MPSRISGACTPCRSKKQKCSGHHPICSQCANSSIECTWPEQRKRGPAKGYIEALESRLHSAESLLLAVLPLVSDNVVDRAVNVLQQEDEEDMDGARGRRSSPPLLNKKTGLDYWDSFPLDSRRNIRKWQLDCEANSTIIGGRYTTSSSTRDNSIVGRTKFRSPTRSPRSSSGLASPPGSSLPTTMPPQQNSWIQSMQPYIPQNHQMQTGAQQLLSLSSQRRDQWMAAQQRPDPMQLDPSLMQQRQHHQPAPSHMYAGNVQQSLFW